MDTEKIQELLDQLIKDLSDLNYEKCLSKELAEIGDIEDFCCLASQLSAEQCVVLCNRFTEGFSKLIDDSINEEFKEWLLDLIKLSVQFPNSIGLFFLEHVKNKKIIFNDIVNEFVFFLEGEVNKKLQEDILTFILDNQPLRSQLNSEHLDKIISGSSDSRNSDDDVADHVTTGERIKTILEYAQKYEDLRDNLSSCLLKEWALHFNYTAWPYHHPITIAEKIFSSPELKCKLNEKDLEILSKNKTLSKLFQDVSAIKKASTAESLAITVNKMKL